MKTSIYRIYTEKRPNLAAFVAERFDGFSIIAAEGYWQGKPEPCAIVELIDTGVDAAETRYRVYELAEDIRVANEQTSVIVTETETFVSTFRDWKGE